MDRPSPLVLRVFPRVVVGIVALVGLIPAMLTLAGDDATARTLGGDFPSFYTAGEIVLDGRIDELYDPAVQAEYQQEFQERDTGVLYFAYPPVTAILYAPFALLPYGVAASAHAVVAIAALVGAMWLILPRVDAALSRRDHVAIGTAVGLATMPVIVAVLGGQNTAFTLILIAATWALVIGERPIVAGLCAGLLLYKPQFGVLLGVVLLLARLWRSVLSFAAVAATAYVVGAITVGVDWPSAWLDQVRDFGDLNAEANGELFVNVAGFTSNVIGSGTASTVVGVVGWSVVAVVTAAAIVRTGITWRTLGLASAAILLLSPSTLFYDAGVGVLTVLTAALGTAGVAAIIAGVVASTWAQALENALGWSPLFVVLLGLWVWQAIAVLRPGVVSQAPGTLAAPAGQEQRSSGWRAIRSS